MGEFLVEFLFFWLYSTSFEISNGAAELEYSVTLYNYRALNFAIFLMYFYNKMAGECTPDVTSRSIIDCHNIPSLLDSVHVMSEEVRHGHLNDPIKLHNFVTKRQNFGNYPCVN